MAPILFALGSAWYGTLTNLVVLYLPVSIIVPSTTVIPAVSTSTTSAKTIIATVLVARVSASTTGAPWIVRRPIVATPSVVVAALVVTIAATASVTLITSLVAVVTSLVVIVVVASLVVIIVVASTVVIVVVTSTVVVVVVIVVTSTVVVVVIVVASTVVVATTVSALASAASLVPVIRTKVGASFDFKRLWHGKPVSTCLLALHKIQKFTCFINIHIKICASTFLGFHPSDLGHETEISICSLTHPGQFSHNKQDIS
mmetsp:Transcript_7649/g.17568  ORF Transcript_7649/g.17568 Transcript_7649/m.17568 type:complete len:258 (+) Transcript_7649:39-812(+)